MALMGMRQLSSSIGYPEACALARTRATLVTVRVMSSSDVCQLQTLMRMQRLPRQVVLLKRAWPLARMAAVMRSVKLS
jgi:hypothetical protein